MADVVCADWVLVRMRELASRLTCGKAEPSGHFRSLLATRTANADRKSRDPNVQLETLISRHTTPPLNESLFPCFAFFFFLWADALPYLFSVAVAKKSERGRWWKEVLSSKSGWAVGTFRLENAFILSLPLHRALPLIG